MITPVTIPALPMPDLSTKRTDGRMLRVLYAEDMRELRELMRIILEGEGHRLDACENGQLALDRLSPEPAAFDLLITDHHMPVMNGLELVEQVRRLGFPGRIVVFSSELNLSVQAGYAALKVDRVLPKPIKPATLRQLVTEMFFAVPASDRG